MVDLVDVVEFVDASGIDNVTGENVNVKSV